MGPEADMDLRPVLEQVLRRRNNLSTTLLSSEEDVFAEQASQNYFGISSVCWSSRCVQIEQRRKRLLRIPHPPFAVPMKNQNQGKARNMSMIRHQYIDRERRQVCNESLYCHESVRFLYSTLRENAPAVFKLLTARLGLKMARIPELRIVHRPTGFSRMEGPEEPRD